jgi:LysR family glycine cleavage system transcriptional activator
MALLPPLETLRVFEVACRHGSYSEAARELHVTHSAVSQRIRQLERDLGLTLFERQGNRMVPTSGGLRLQAGVKNAFSELGAALGSIKTHRTDAEITVSLLPVMAARWLVPRLPRFKARFPRINLHIKSGQSLANFKSDGVDIAIRFGTGDWKGLRAIKLLNEEFFPVCSPSLNDGRLPKDPASMLSQPDRPLHSPDVLCLEIGRGLVDVIDIQCNMVPADIAVRWRRLGLVGRLILEQFDVGAKAAANHADLIDHHAG